MGGLAYIQTSTAHAQTIGVEIAAKKVAYYKTVALYLLWCLSWPKQQCVTTISAQTEETAHILINNACVLRDGRGHNADQVGK